MRSGREPAASARLDEAPDLHLMLFVREFAGLRAVIDPVPDLFLAGSRPRVNADTANTAKAAAWADWWSSVLLDSTRIEQRVAEAALDTVPEVLKATAHGALDAFRAWWPQLLPVRPGMPDSPLLSAFALLGEPIGRQLASQPPSERWRIEVLALAGPWQQQLGPEHWVLSISALQTAAGAASWVRNHLPGGTAP